MDVQHEMAGWGPALSLRHLQHLQVRNGNGKAGAFMNYKRGKLKNSGGEGDIYEVAGYPHLLMKIYHEHDAQGERILTPGLLKKLEFMKSNPPGGLVSGRLLAWPLELMYEGEEARGFVMPKLAFDAHIREVYAYKHPKFDEQDYADFPSSKSRIGIAVNLAATVNLIHEQGFVIGDLNHENIGINKETAAISIADCDSFHIEDGEGHVFRTNVIMPGYLAPEIINHCNQERGLGKPYTIDKVAMPTFTRESDLFCLAVHIFKLLMNGVDPFRGVLSNAAGSVASPFQGNEAVERNAYVFKDGNVPSAVFCLRSDQVPPKIASLFDKAFLDGHTDPSARPSAAEWYHALMEYYSALIPCKSNREQKHFYYKELERCPFCEADERYSAVQIELQKNLEVKEEPSRNPDRKRNRDSTEKRFLFQKMFAGLLFVLFISFGIAYFYAQSNPAYDRQNVYHTSTTAVPDNITPVQALPESTENAGSSDIPGTAAPSQDLSAPASSWFDSNRDFRSLTLNVTKSMVPDGYTIYGINEPTTFSITPSVSGAWLIETSYSDSVSVDPYLRLLDEYGQELIFSDDSGIFDAYNASILTHLNEGTQYYLYTDVFDESVREPYEIHALDYVWVEEGRSYDFTPISTETYVIATQSEGGVDPILRLDDITYNEQEPVLLAESDDWQNTRDARIEATLFGGRKYKLSATYYGQSPLGYRLMINRK